MDKVVFKTNVPQVLRLKYLEGKECDSNFGEPQYMFSTDQGAFFVSQAAGAVLNKQIVTQQIRLGEAIAICKGEVQSAGGRKSIQWQLTRADHSGAGASTPTPAATTAASPSTSNGNGSSPNGNGANGNGGNGHAASDLAMVHLGWARLLVSQTNALVDCYSACLSYANKHGNAIKPEDVRSLMTTAFISLAKKGGTDVA